jgi:hypothetical protein
MARYYFQVSDDDGLSKGVSVNFEADDIYTVLERFQAFLKASEFPFVDEVSAVCFDPEDPSQDIHYYSDGTVMTAEELDNQYNRETVQ